MPVHLAFVRHHGPIDIGLVILVTGIAQLVSAPVTIWLDRRYGARLLTGIGFAFFALGLAMSGFETRASDYDEMFWPQVIRGSFVALCILPATRFALGLLPLERVSDASGLYNLSRNLGGAIGIALIDTILFSRGPEHASFLTELMANQDALALGNGDRMGTLSDAILKWNADGRHDAVVTKLRDLVAAGCAALDATGDDSQQGRCQRFLVPEADETTTG